MNITDNDIHIWHIGFETCTETCIEVHIEKKEASLDKCKKLLSTDEHERVKRLRSSALRHRFILARGDLRIILGKYLNKQPEEIVFTYNKHGKPTLQHELIPIEFNISHCQTMSLVAVTLGCKVGIDIERTGRFESWDNMVKHSLSQQEQEELYGLPVSEQEQAFIRGWTRKEAYTKAIGVGLLYDFSAFSITLEASPIRIDDPNNTKNLSKWELINIVMEQPYLATVAVNRRGMQLTEYKSKIDA